MEAAEKEPVYTVSMVNDALYEIICVWWQAHRWQVLPRSMLPSNGVVISVDGVPAVAGFLYLTDSKISWLEWIVGNPEMSPFVRRPAIKKLLEVMTQLSDSLGYRVMFSSLSHRGLMTLYEEAGFEKTDTEMTNFMRRAHVGH